MSETSPTYRTGDSGDEQPEDWGGTLLPVPLSDQELREIAIEYASEAVTSDVRRLLAEVERLRQEIAEGQHLAATAVTGQHVAEMEEYLLNRMMSRLDQELARHRAWQAGVPYTPEGKRR